MVPVSQRQDQGRALQSHTAAPAPIVPILTPAPLSDSPAESDLEPHNLPHAGDGREAPGCHKTPGCHPQGSTNKPAMSEGGQKWEPVCSRGVLQRHAIRAGDVPRLKHQKASLETQNSSHHAFSSPWLDATGGKNLIAADCLDVAFHKSQQLELEILLSS